MKLKCLIKPAITLLVCAFLALFVYLAFRSLFDTPLVFLIAFFVILYPYCTARLIVEGNPIAFKIVYNMSTIMFKFLSKMFDKFDDFPALWGLSVIVGYAHVIYPGLFGVFLACLSAVVVFLISPILCLFNKQSNN